MPTQAWAWHGAKKRVVGDLGFALVVILGTHLFIENLRDPIAPGEIEPDAGEEGVAGRVFPG